MKILTTLMATSAAVAWLMASAGDASAADHRDGAAVKTDPSTDINDVYAWTSPDGAKVYLALTVFPVADATAKFSNAAKYVFHLRSGATYGAAATQDVRIICGFAADQKISCWAVQGSNTVDYVTGDASAAAGISSESGKLKVFAGSAMIRSTSTWPASKRSPPRPAWRRRASCWTPRAARPSRLPRR